MEQKSGVVSRIHENTIDGKFGPFTLYGFQLVEDGDGVYYNTGKVKPTCTEGQTVSFYYNIEFSQQGKARNQVQPNHAPDIKVDETIPMMEVGSVKTFNAHSGTGGNSRANYWEEKAVKDEEMLPEWRYRTALQHAVAFMGVLTANEAIVFPKTATPKTKFDLLVKMRDQFAEDFVTAFEDANGAVAVPEESEAVEEEAF